MAEQRERKEKTGDVCYCEKGIVPEKSPRAEYRCPQCGKMVWPKAMGEETGKKK